jgi:hypothetical protein
MAKPDILIVDGHAFSWQRLCDLRRLAEDGKVIVHHFGRTG